MSKELKTTVPTTGSDDSGPSFGPAKPGSGVHVLWGAVADHYDLAGSTVQQTLDALSGVLAIPKDDTLRAVVNGKIYDLASDTPLKEGDVLEFTRRLGEKGMETEGYPALRLFAGVAWRMALAMGIGFVIGYVLFRLV